MNLSLMEQAVEEAKTTLRRADMMVPQMLRLIKGRLRKVGDGYGDRQLLADLKKELRGFNITRRQWKEEGA